LKALLPLLLILFLSLMPVLLVSAQERVLRGVVKDAETGQSIPGVQVVSLS